MTNKLKADLIKELQAAQERIAELENAGTGLPQRKNVEDLAGEKEAYLKGVLDAAPDAMFIIDTDGRIKFANRQAEAVFGFTQSELTGLQVEHFIPKALRANHVKKRQGFIKDPRPLVAGVSREIRAVRRDGSEFIVEISLNPYKQRGESMVLAAMHDVTRRRQAEELVSVQRDLARMMGSDLTEREIQTQCLQAALRISGMDSGGIYLFDETRQNLVLAHHSGLGANFVTAIRTYPVDSPSAKMVLSGKNLYLTNADLSVNKYHQDEGLHFLVVIPIHHKGRVLGSLNIASHTQTSILPEAQAALEAVAVEIGNVFSSHQTNRELRESEEKYRSLVESQEASIFVVDVEGVLHYINEFGARLLGKAVTDLAGRKIQDQSPRKNMHQIMAVARVVFKSGQRVTTEQKWTDNEKMEWRRVSIQPIRDAGRRVYRVMIISSDITEQKKMEEERIETDERYRLLYQTMFQGVAFQDADGRIIHANPAAQEILGLSLDQMQGRAAIDPDWRAIHEDGSDFPDETHPARVALQTGRLVRDVVMGVYNPAQSSFRWININAVPRFRDGEDKPYQVYTTFEDITGRRQAEEALKFSEENYRSLAETSTSSIAVVDYDGKILYANPVSLRLWQDEKFTGKTLQMLFPAELSESYLNIIRHVIDEKTILESEMETRINGRQMSFLVNLSPIRSKDGSVHSLLFSAFDITQRKQAEAALRESEERLRLSLTASRQGLYDLNVQTGETIVNREYVEMLGYDPETFVETNQAWIDRLHPDDARAATETYEDYIAGRIPEYRVEFRQRTKDGTWKWMLSLGKIVEYDTSGKPLRMLGTHTDIDYLKQAEQERRKLIHDLGERVKELTALHHTSRLFQNPDLSEAEVMQSLTNALPAAWQYPDVTVARIVIGSDEYASPGFVESKWVQREDVQLPGSRSGSIEVFYLKEMPEEFEGPFLKEERELLKTLAEQIQTSMARKFMEQSLRRRTGDLTALVEAGRALGETLNTLAIYAIIHHYISGVMPCDFLVISSYDPVTNLIRCEHLHSNEGVQDVSGFPPIPLEPPGQGTQSKVIRSGESLFLPDYDVFLKEAGKVVYFDEKGELYDDVTDDEERTRSAILVPLKEKGVVTGVLQVMSMKLNAHTHDHLQFTEALGFHISAALSNAKLFSELEERVRQRTAEVQDLYDNAPAGYHSLDAEGRYISVNQTELDWFGYTREEMIGHPAWDFIAGDYRQKAIEAFQLFKQVGRLNDLELELIRADGTLFPVLVNSSAVLAQDGTFLSSRATLFDNTERKKAEQILREREENYRALFENANDVILLIDLDGNIVGSNPRTTEIMGYSSEELAGRHATDFIVKNELEDAYHQLARLKAGERLPVYERTLIRKDGGLIETDINLSLVRDEAGNPKFIQSVIRDISTRKRAEETLRLANAELERALRLKDEFLANMSHELRTPLNAVLGISESMLEEVSGPLTEKQRKYLQTVMESAQHLLELINDILDLAKINAGRVQLAMERFDVQSLAQTSLRMIRELAQKKGLTVRFEIDPVIKTAWADERRLKQMLVNLLSNAVKFTPEGGEIGLKIGGDEIDQLLYFTVWDTGIGIAEKDLRHLFQPFVQLDGGLARSSQGTGLGLVLVSQMARLHGGSVSVTSQPRAGSRFTLTIPWVNKGITGSLPPKPDPEPPVHKNPVSQPRPNAPLILLVEDTEAVTMLIRDYLFKYGYKVITARDGFEGIARIQEATPDLILMDVMMPELDGIETTRRIRKQMGLEKVPIIALTALAMAGDRERCLEAGMNGYLSKPVDLKELLAVIEDTLKGIRKSSDE